MRWMAAMCLVFVMTEACGEEANVLKTRKDMVSYGIGVNIAKSFKKDAIEFDVDLIVKGMKDGMSGDKLLMSERDLRRVMNAFQSELRQKETMNHRIAAEDNRRKGEAFLAENRTKDGVVALPSGVQYRVIKAGEGRKPADGGLVECNYRGTLLDGTEFDATEGGKPATLKVSQLIEGWKEVLKLMPEGSKWQIFIPSQLAYGPRGVGSEIGPNETLVFEVDLVAVK